MTMRENLIKERNAALFSLDREKIEEYIHKYKGGDTDNVPDIVFWAGVYKAICHIKGAPTELVATAHSWLYSHGFSPSIQL